jgi:hypothetical protein
MENEFRPGDHFQARGQVPDITLDKLNIIEYGSDVLPFSRRKIIQDPDPVSPFEESPNKVRADETRSAGYQTRGHAVQAPHGR